MSSRPRPASRSRRPPWLLPAVAGLFALSGQACGSCGQKTLGVIEGPVNDPSNRSLRRSILAWGLKEMCAEMTSRSAPLSLAYEGPSVGRFFPETCAQREAPNGNVVVDFTGRGYAFTNVTKKLSFFARAAVEYNQDFLMDGSTMYAYFRTQRVDASDFRVLVIENPAASVVNAWTSLGDGFGQRLLADRLRDGFTVVRESDGSAELAMGLLPKGQRPPRHVGGKGEGRLTAEAGRSEVHEGERDVVGPLKVSGAGRALFLTAAVDGAAAADVLLLRKPEGDVARDLYLRYPSHGPIPGAPLMSDTLRAGMETTRTVPVPEGLYYVVLDNTPSAGSSSPPMNPFDDRAAVIRYAIQVGDAP